MSKTVIDREKGKKIIYESYKIIRKKERENSTKESAVNEMVKMIKKEVKENDN